VLFDCLTEPEEQVTDWRTKYTGIDAVTFEAIRSGADPTLIAQMDLPKLVLPTAVAVAKVNALLDHVVVIGHDLRRDFHLLGRSQCRSLLRDTAFYPLLALGLSAKRFSGGLPSLRALAAEWLEDEKLHKGAHSSVEDARAAVLLYRLVKQEWDSFAEKKFGAPVWTDFLALRSQCCSSGASLFFFDVRTGNPQLPLAARAQLYRKILSLAVLFLSQAQAAPACEADDSALLQEKTLSHVTLGESTQAKANAKIPDLSALKDAFGNVVDKVADFANKGVEQVTDKLGAVLGEADKGVLAMATKCNASLKAPANLAVEGSKFRV
ncbi:rex-4, partial [Symbiodinium microadriaticum]